MRNRLRLFIILILILAMLFTGASVPGDCSLTLHLTTDSQNEDPSGVEIEVIKVADVTGSGLVYCADFSSFDKDIDSLAEKGFCEALTGFINNNGIQGTVVTTDKDGFAVLRNLDQGVYYSREKSVKENSPVFAPFLSVIPTDGKKDVTVEPKTVARSITDETISLTVKKVWNDDGKNRPDSVKVKLSSEDGEKETITLSSANSWTYKWEDLAKDKKWSVEEIDIPSGYKATYSSEGTVVTITNTAKLIQTGQTDWPLPVLFFAGMLFISAGVMLKIVGRKNDDE